MAASAYRPWPWLLLVLLFATAPVTGRAASSERPVVIGLDAEFGLKDSTSAQAIERGIRIAIDEINRAGGVLDGRPLTLRTTDNRSVTARGIANVKELATDPDLVAIFGGRFSPVVIEVIPTVHQEGIILLAPWSAADGIVNNGHSPNYVFRLSLQDSVAVDAMMRHALAKGATEVGLLLPNTSWGRSNLDSIERYATKHASPAVVATRWFQWGDQSMISKYKALRAAGAEAIIFIANDAEAVFLVKEMASLPEDEIVPLVCHWGVTGGRFADLVGPALERVDVSVVQTFSFFSADEAAVERVLEGANRLFGITRIEEIESPVGVAHAYDLTHLLARAIELAGTTDRKAVRDALERVRDYRGLVKHFDQPFSPTDHEALGSDEVFMAHYGPDGVIRPLVGPASAKKLE